MREHIHKYLRVINDKKEGYIVYKCVVPGCTHYQRRELLLGNEAICWVCNLGMVLSLADLGMKKPRHFECRRVRPSVKEAA